MKLLRYLAASVATALLITACQRELSSTESVPVTPQGPARGALQKTATGDCAPINVGGAYAPGTTLSAANYLEVQVRFSTAGSYVLQTDTVNGYSFRASGVAANTGAATVRLTASGRPVAAGSDLFTVRFDSSSCVATVPVSTAAAVYSFGAAGACTGATLAGTYTNGVALTAANSAALQVTVTTAGAYSISTDTVNGIYFSASGTFSATGTQALTLTGSGTALTAGNSTLTVHGGCSFTVPVASATGALAQLTTTSATGVTCTGAASGGNISSDGGTAITARGICYGSAANPTTAQTVISSGTGTGAFTATLTGLTAGTTYHVRAFATNSAGTAYGNDITVTTSTGCQVGVYVTGYDDAYNISGNIRTPKTWKNSTGTALPFTNGTEGGESIFVSGSDVYVAGSQNGYASLWKNGVLTVLGAPPTPPQNFTSAGYSVYVSGSDVYVAGVQSNVATVWKNGTGTPLSQNSNGLSEAHSVFVSGTDVYVAGWEYEYVNSNYTKVAKLWKNGVATSLSNGTTEAEARSVFVSGSDVYVAGKDGNAAQLWKNGVAGTLSVFGSDQAEANSVFVSGTDVYVAGTEHIGNTPHSYARVWKNGVGTNLTSGDDREGAYGVFAFGTDVYVVGHTVSFWANDVATLWKNGVKSNLTGGSTDARALAIFVK